MIEGRKEWKSKLEAFSKEDSKETIWIHCASLGEFEQGRPIIEVIKKKWPEVKIALSFFSPSGYEIRKDYPLADLVIYLPFDEPKNAKTFIDLLKPKMAIFVKYEFWLHYFRYLKKQDIPILSVSSIFRENQYFFKPWGSAGREALSYVHSFYVQDNKSKQLLENIQISNSVVCGDTRYDRVKSICEEAKDIPLIENFIKHFNLPVLVIGSSWGHDLSVIAPALKNLNQEFLVIIAPHEIGKESIGSTKSAFSFLSPFSFSSYKNDKVIKGKCLIIDNIGMLSRIYGYASVCYVGGAFGKGLHNTLEAATWGKPVVFGGKFSKFNEAKLLVENKGGFSINDSKEAEEVFQNLLFNTQIQQHHGNIAKSIVKSGWGATETIAKAVEQLLEN